MDLDLRSGITVAIMPGFLSSPWLANVNEEAALLERSNKAT
jgi:hypothetical protein